MHHNSIECSTHSLTAALDQLRVVASSTSNDPGPRSRQHQQIGQRLLPLPTIWIRTLSMHLVWIVLKTDWLKLDPQGWVSSWTSPLNPRPCHAGWPQGKATQGKHKHLLQPISPWTTRRALPVSSGRSAGVGFYWQLKCLRSRCVLR